MTDETPSRLSARELAAEYATGTVFDITECAREPIHLLGSVQSHGALLALAEPDLTVAVASANTAALLGVAPEVLLGLPVAEILGAEQARQLREAASDDDSVAAIVPVQLEEGKAGYQLEASVHRGDGLVICEFEPPADQPFRFSSFYPGARRALLQLEGTRTVTGLCQAAVRQVRAFTGYDRVVAYRFDGDGPGEVIAEDVAPGWEPWLGLWFPAIDVPPQARRLYLQNWIRVIADVDDRGAALVPPLRPGTLRPLDLSGSALRTVSSYHLEYLRNIGVRGSMSLSLIQDGRLWGLIACHSGTPRRLTADQRAACEMFGIALSLQLDAVEDRQRAAGKAEARESCSRWSPLPMPSGQNGLASTSSRTPGCATWSAPMASMRASAPPRTHLVWYRTCRDCRPCWRACPQRPPAGRGRRTAWARNWASWPSWLVTALACC